MVAPIKVILTEAFMPLALDISKFGGIFRAEADMLYHSDFVDAALARKVCAQMDTQVGSVLYLANRGRMMVGLAGYFKPRPENLENSVCLRDADRTIRTAGHQVKSIERQRRGSLIQQLDNTQILVLAQAFGFNRAVIRRIYKTNVESGIYAGLHLYSYLHSTELMGLGMLLLHSGHPNALPIDSEKLRIYAISPWPRALPETQSKVLLSQEVNEP